MRIQSRHHLASALLYVAVVTSVQAQSSAFTYQGRLSDNGAPANGIYDLQFTVYRCKTGCTPVGAVTNAATPVSNGLFTVSLDFGTDIFDGTVRWLEIGAVTNGGGPFETLTPRQPLTPVPYALHALSVNTNGLSGGTYANAVTFNNPANSFTGNGAGVTNVNARTLQGLDAAAFWQAGGNAGTTAGVNFLGTTDDQPLELYVNHQRVLRFENIGDGNDTDTIPDGAPNMIGGSPVNFAAAGVVGATIAGGGATNRNGTARTNSVLADFGSVLGGIGNTASGTTSTAMGSRSTASGSTSTAMGSGSTASGSTSTAMGGGNTASGTASMAMGLGNTASGDFSTAMGEFTIASGYASVAMGYNTTAMGDYSTAMGELTSSTGVTSTAMGELTHADGDNSTAMGLSTVASGIASTAMGSGTVASGFYSTAMGRGTIAGGHYSIAAGRNAHADHYGSIVLTDSETGIVSSTAEKQFTIRATGGTRIFSNAGASIGTQLAASGNSWAVISDRHRKKNITPLDGRVILDKLAEVAISTWRYDFESGEDTPHIGPMAQDFKAAFYPGRDDKSITTHEFDGVALAAIQGLNQKVTEELNRRDAENAELKRSNAALERRLAALERLIGNHGSN